jgi:hypothetical protein
VTACAAVLGIEAPSEPPGESEAAPPDGEDPDARDAVAIEGGAALATDAAPADDAADALLDQAPMEDSGLPTIGVPCGGQRCAGTQVCCYNTAPVKPLDCVTPDQCTGGNPVGCDGPEDCRADQLCCLGLAPRGTGFSSSCATECGAGAVVCHTAMATCMCKTAVNSCAPLTTCGGKCP